MSQLGFGFAVLQYVSRRRNPQTGQCYAWTNRVRWEDAAQWQREARERWPGTQVTIVKEGNHGEHRRGKGVSRSGGRATRSPAREDEASRSDQARTTAVSR